AAACGIENRMPFMTSDLAEFAFSLPDDYLVGSDGTIKTVLRRAMDGLVPAPVLARRQRVGFAIPLQQWLAELRPLIDPLVEDAAKVPGFNHPYIRRAWADVHSGTASSWGTGLQIWRCAVFAHWARRFNVAFD